jgi:hypothetical protein
MQEHSAMTDKQTQAQADKSNMEKDPKDWVTGDEPMTGAQRSYLKTLSEEAREPFDETLSKADASRRIDELQARTGRGVSGKSTQAQQQPSSREHPDRPEGGGGQGAPGSSEVERTTAASGYTGA